MNSQKQTLNILGDILISVVTQEQEISKYIQQQLFNNWNPVLPLTFHGAQIIFNYVHLQYKCLQQQQVFSKRRRVIKEVYSH